MRTLNLNMPIKANPDSLYISSLGMSAAELREHLRPASEKAKQDAWAKNTYITYYDETLCPDTSYAIHEYSDRKELVKLENGNANLIKIL
jgi:hypothetical protein|nr:hypothetical protein [uncultured Mucilaginibacter sp.]